MGDVRSLSVLNEGLEFQISIGKSGLPWKTLQIAEKR